MEKVRKYKTAISALLFFALYYVVIDVLKWPLTYLVAFLGVALVIACVVFRAGLFAGMANIYYSSGKRDKAKAMFERSFRHHSRNPVVYMNYAVLNLHDGDAATALETAQKALTLKPNVLTEKNLHLAIGNCYWVLGRIDEAISYLEGMLEKYDYVNAHVLSTLGYLYILTGEMGKARELSEKAVADMPDHAAAWDNLGQIAFKEGDLDKAEAMFLKAENYRSDLVDSLYFLGEIYEKKGELKNARDYYTRAFHARISSLNTVTKEQVAEKYQAFVNMDLDTNELEHEEDVKDASPDDEQVE